MAMAARGSRRFFSLERGIGMSFDAFGEGPG